ncbi:MAG: CRISPR system precrRNA processing endoribonuclease RAMP protein Cas6 [Desulfocapsaceae bacterium]|nr:CRISPR system precrRNA processing endoribonuclease RAMP protein Cas6 [Desulfocapsaceae bacterium]
MDGTGPRRPHPYILIPPDDTQRSWNKDEPFAFSIAVFGRANDYLPHLVYAVREMGKAGLGKKAPDQGRFRLETVREKETVIFDGTTLRSQTQLLELTLGSPEEPPVKEIILTCLTPLRLKYDNQLQDGLPFHLLIRAALRRISSLEAAYAAGEPPLNYKGIAARATSVHQFIAECRWTDFERYSNRQKTAMSFGGMLGRMGYQGEDLGEFLPLLRYCEITHIGKQTSFGLGRIKVEVAT